MAERRAGSSTTPGPDYFAAFRGGPHPVHPNARCWHEQYVEVNRDGGLVRRGRLIESGESVYSIVGAWAWYRFEDMQALLRGARDEAYRSLADHFA